MGHWNGHKMRIPHCERNYGLPDGMCTGNVFPGAHLGKLAILRRYGLILDLGRDTRSRVMVEWIPSEESEEEGFTVVTCRAGSYREAVDRLHRHVAAAWCRLAGNIQARMSSHGDICDSGIPAS